MMMMMKVMRAVLLSMRNITVMQRIVPSSDSHLL